MSIEELSYSEGDYAVDSWEMVKYTNVLSGMSIPKKWVESMTTIRPQNSAQAQNLNTPTPQTPTKN